MSKINNKNLLIFQKGFNYSQDGPGNRLVYHLSGCNMCCPWCSNPEGMTQSKDNMVVSVDDLVAEAEASKMIFIDGGGVTFTGGEVTLQKDSVLSAVKLLKEKGISTCIETNASLTDCEELFNEIDFMIADFKSPFKEKLKEFTNGDIEVIKENLLFRAKTKKPLLVRIPLIHFFNCGDDNATAFAEFFNHLQKESDSDELYFEILTYHEFGKDKYEKIGKSYAVADGFVTDDDVKLLVNKLKAFNLKIVNT